MSQASTAADFAYGAPAGAIGEWPVSLSIYGDRAHLRAQIREDAQAAGLQVAAVGDLAELLESKAGMPGDIVLLDCSAVDAAAMAALSRLDMQAAQGGTRLIVSTSIEALDEVFACMDQSDPWLLVDPTRADRLIALGQVLSGLPAKRLRELSEQDRLLLLRLSEQVGKIAEKMDRLAPAGSQPATFAEERAFRFESPRSDFFGEDGNKPTRLARAARTPLPDPRLVRRIIRQRQLRTRFFDGELFADPAWDMLLDLAAARAEHTRVSVTSLCIASGVPPTTALRWISQLIEAGLFERVDDDTDRRRAFISLTDKAADAMAGYFAELGGSASLLA